MVCWEFPHTTLLCPLSSLRQLNNFQKLKKKKKEQHCWNSSPWDRPCPEVSGEGRGKGGGLWSGGFQPGRRGLGQGPRHTSAPYFPEQHQRWEFNPDQLGFNIHLLV